MVIENWIRTDEAEDVAGSIRHVLRSAQFVTDDAQAWKWVMLAMHSALQGACVAHLTTTATPVGAVTDRNAREWLAYFDHSRTDPNVKAPNTVLMALPDLLKAVRKPFSAGDRRNDIGIEITESELSWLRRFHQDIRNQFVHFAPMAWPIEVSGVPEIASLIARIINDIFEIGWAFRNQELEIQQEMLQNLQALALFGRPK